MGNHFAAEVHLEHDVYYPGNVVRGEATILVEKPLKCIAARIMCRGLERAIVVRSAGEYSHPISQDSVFYKESLTLFGHTTKDADATPVEIPPGTYTYPFAFQLPMHLPASAHMTSWASGGVEVRYAVIAYAKVDKDTVEEGHQSFTVIVPVNKSEMERSPPAAAAGTVKLSSFFLDKGSADVRVNLKRSLFAADEVIDGEIEIDNTNGKIDISGLKLSVQAKVESHVLEKICGVEGGMRGCASADPVLNVKMSVTVEKGHKATVPLHLKLPHVIPATSYPARNLHIAARHDLTVSVAGRQIVVPIHIAHCSDAENRFSENPIAEVCHKPEHVDFEHIYNAPDGYVATPCPDLKSPEGLTFQPRPMQLTPQATGNGLLAVAPS